MADVQFWQILVLFYLICTEIRTFFNRFLTNYVFSSISVHFKNYTLWPSVPFNAVRFLSIYRSITSIEQTVTLLRRSPRRRPNPLNLGALNFKIHWSRDGAVASALASHDCGTGSRIFVWVFQFFSFHKKKQFLLHFNQDRGSVIIDVRQQQLNVDMSIDENAAITLKEKMT